jgi:hypothetical protein
MFIPSVQFEKTLKLVLSWYVEMDIPKTFQISVHWKCHAEMVVWNSHHVSFERKLQRMVSGRVYRS